jgi:TRAP-type C4-dicarboxylate transport system substrate-binding protein
MFKFIMKNIWLTLCLLLVAPAGAGATELRLRIVGGLAGVSQFQQLESPFWSDEIARLTNGRVSATIHAFDRSGLRGQDMLQLMRLGVVPFGTALVSLVAGDEPEIGAMDLPGLSPDIGTLRRNVALFRPHLERILSERYGIELLGVYAYPAQVLFCARPFDGLADLQGRRIRTSSVSQSELVDALGGIPVVTPFSEIVGAVTRNVVDCAITGTLSGNQIGLSDVTTHVHTMAISWGLSVFAANRGAWNEIPADLRATLRDGVRALEARIWEAAELDTSLGLACNLGRASCPNGRPARMQLVPGRAADEALLRDVVARAVIPRWLERCGAGCREGWDATIGPAVGVRLGTSRSIGPVAGTLDGVALRPSQD